MAQRIDRAAAFGQNVYVDTRGAAGEPVPFTQAVINGLAQGGGLYVPEELPTLSLDEICALARLPYAQRAAAIYKAFNVDLPDEAIDELMGRAYGDNFDDEAICPITSLDESTHILEPVSYTHLDVYKRQILTRPETPDSFCCIRDERRCDEPISPLYTAARGPAWEASEGLPASYWR